MFVISGLKHIQVLLKNTLHKSLRFFGLVKITDANSNVKVSLKHNSPEKHLKELGESFRSLFADKLSLHTVCCIIFFFLLLCVIMEQMLTAQCNGYRIMTPSAFRLVSCKPCINYAILSAARENES